MTQCRQKWWLAGALFVTAVGVRAISGWGLFFDPAIPGHRQFEIFDSTYHLRRVESTLQTYPRVPFKDAYHYFPDAPDVPWPPGYTLFLATVVKLTGTARNPLLYETVLGFVPPVMDAITVALFFLLFTRWVPLPQAFLAGTLLAFSYQNRAYSELGYIDHHYFITFMIAILAWLYTLYHEKPNLKRAGILGAWVGGMVYFNVSAIQYSLLALGAAAAISLWTRAQKSPWKPMLVMFGAATVTSLLAGLSTPAGQAGKITYDQTSLFQCLAVLALAGAWVMAASALTLKGRRRATILSAMLIFFGALSVTIWPQIREGAEFLFKGNRLNGIQGEEVSIRVYGYRWHQVFFWMAIFLPWGIRHWWRQRHSQTIAFVLVATFFCYGIFTGFSHFLYVQYLYPWYALMVASGAGAMASTIPQTWRYAALVPFIGQLLYSSGSLVLDKKSTGETEDRRAIAMTAQAFDWLGQHAPQDGTVSVLAHRDHGHMIVRWAHLPVIVSPFSTTAFVGHMQDYVRATFSLSEEALVNIMEKYRSRYLALDFRDNLMVPFLLGTLSGEPDERTVAAEAQRKLFSVRNNLLFFDGELRWRQTPSVGHFRLIYEVPKTVTTPLQTPQGKVKHTYNALKIFERVTGATLASKGWPAGERVVARLPLKTGAGRTWLYTAYARADVQGRARITVAYPTQLISDSAVVPLSDHYEVGVTPSSTKKVTVPPTAVTEGMEIAF